MCFIVHDSARRFDIVPTHREREREAGMKFICDYIRAKVHTIASKYICTPQGDSDTLTLWGDEIKAYSLLIREFDEIHCFESNTLNILFTFALNWLCVDARDLANEFSGEKIPNKQKSQSSITVNVVVRVNVCNMPCSNTNTLCIIVVIVVVCRYYFWERIENIFVSKPCQRSRHT